jgi:hypothetical protein
MQHFLEGVIAGFLVGGMVAYKAFESITARVANRILTRAKVAA